MKYLFLILLLNCITFAEEVTFLKGRVADRLYRVGKEWVARSSNRPLYAIERTRARSAMAARLKIGPYFLGGSGQWVITKWVEGIHPKSLSDAQIQIISQHLRHLHQTPLDQYTPVYSIGMRAHRRLSEMEKRCAPCALLREILKKMEDALEETLEETSAVIVHGDLNPGNILVTPQGSIMFIDWADSVVSDPFDDLGAIAHFFGFSPQQEEVLLSQYFNRPPLENERKKLLIKRLQTLTHQVVWWVNTQFLKRS